MHWIRKKSRNGFTHQVRQVENPGRCVKLLRSSCHQTFTTICTWSISESKNLKEFLEYWNCFSFSDPERLLLCKVLCSMSFNEAHPWFNPMQGIQHSALLESSYWESWTLYSHEMQGYEKLTTHAISLHFGKEQEVFRFERKYKFTKRTAILSCTMSLRHIRYIRSNGSHT